MQESGEREEDVEEEEKIQVSTHRDVTHWLVSSTLTF